VNVKKERTSQYSVFEDRMSAEYPTSSLMIVDIMLTELCNRTCDFCPRAVDYPNLNLHMDLDLFSKICDDLSDVYYQNRVLLCGFGENLLYKNIYEAIQILRSKLPYNEYLQIVTNGDRLTKDIILKLYESGLNRIYVSCYDGIEQVEHFQSLFDELNIDNNNYYFMHYYKPPEENYGFVHYSNRGGKLFNDTSYLNRGCNSPFYAMQINWDGKVLLCSHDWTKSVVCGDLKTEYLKNIWLHSPQYKQYRSMLINKRDVGPCNKCNVVGTLYGDKSRELLHNA
jgi:radical SAM protein with 4Fe4S-binding SPASM domain